MTRSVKVKRTVYIAERGCYENTYPVGVFDTPERAIAACHEPGDVWQRSQESADDISWSNDKDWDSYVQIIPIDFITEGPSRPPDSAVVRWDSEDGRRVEYHPVPVDGPYTPNEGEVSHPNAIQRLRRGMRARP